jgi:hypothetical protein
VVLDEAKRHAGAQHEVRRTKRVARVDEVAKDASVGDFGDGAEVIAIEPRPVELSGEDFGAEGAFSAIKGASSYTAPFKSGPSEGVAFRQNATRGDRRRLAACGAARPRITLGQLRGGFSSRARLTLRRSGRRRNGWHPCVALAH